MHVFLTGAPGVGKSTALYRTLTLLNISPGGFLTYFGPDRDSLYLGPAWLPRAYPAERIVARMADGRPVADPAAFDQLGPAAIHGLPGAKLLLFDECGGLEREALFFQQAVLSALDGSVPILGVIKPQRAGTWLTGIQDHPRVVILPVTVDNRDALPELLVTRVRCEA